MWPLRGTSSTSEICSAVSLRTRGTLCHGYSESCSRIARVLPDAHVGEQRDGTLIRGDPRIELARSLRIGQRLGTECAVFPANDHSIRKSFEIKIR
jgi:hypothetical protein